MRGIYPVGPGCLRGLPHEISCRSPPQGRPGITKDRIASYARPPVQRVRIREAARTAEQGAQPKFSACHVPITNTARR